MTPLVGVPDWVARVDRRSLQADAVAGLLGAVLVLPQAVAFAALAGLPVQYGINTAIVPCIIAALFGSSWHVMSGPTNAHSLALQAMLVPLVAVNSTDYVQAALALTVMVGLMQAAIGLCRMGTVANFLSPTALSGFTSGAALLIAWHALDPLRPALQSALQSGSGFRALPALLVPAGVMLVAVLGSVLLRARWPRCPHLLLGLVMASLAAALLQAINPSWAIARLGQVPFSLPHWHVPELDWRRLPDFMGAAAALTLIGLAQSISIAKAVAARSGQRIDPNREFIGQGLANLFGGLTQCFVSCGSMNRSVPNFESGARTPLSSVFSALLLIPVVLLAGPWFEQVPHAAISGLLLVAAWSLLDAGRLQRIRRASTPEFLIALATLMATLLLRLEYAVLIGSALSLGLFLHRTSHPAMRTMGFDRLGTDRRFVIVDRTPQALPECPQLKLLRMEGSVYFGATAHVADRLQALHDCPHPQPHLLVMAKSMNFVDVAGIELWRAELKRRRALGGDLYFHRPRPDVVEAWERAGFIDEIGRRNLFPDKAVAIAAIFPRLSRPVCATCTVRLFHECRQAPEPCAASCAEPGAERGAEPGAED